MWWYLFFVLIIFILSVPLVYQAQIKFNVMNMSGEFSIKIWFIKLTKVKVKIKKNYIYVTKKGITYKEKLAPNNVDIIFILNLLKSLYFRGVLIRFDETAEIGYLNNAMTTAFATTATDLIIKGLLAKIKTNKKLSMITIQNTPIYDVDCINVSLNIAISINFFDMLYSLVASKINAKGTKYEKEKDIEDQVGNW